MTDIEQEAHAAADARFPELPLAPENEQRAEDFAEGYIAGASRPAPPATRETVTEEMVERAAMSLWTTTQNYQVSGTTWDGLYERAKERRRREARAALEAALGVEKGGES